MEHLCILYQIYNSVCRIVFIIFLFCVVDLLIEAVVLKEESRDWLYEQMEPNGPFYIMRACSAALLSQAGADWPWRTEHMPCTMGRSVLGRLVPFGALKRIKMHYII